MRKRIMTLFLAVFLLFHMEVETFLAINMPQQYGTNSEHKTDLEEETNPEHKTDLEEETNPEHKTDLEEETNPNTKTDLEKEKRFRQIPEENSLTNNTEDIEQQEEKFYKITFDFSGGNSKNGKKNFYQMVAEGAFPNTNNIITPVKKGYLLQGWIDESGNFYMFDQPIYRDITLKAAWTPITYHIRFDGNGGKGTIPTQMQLVYGEKKNLPMNTFLRKGYVFCGWSQEGEKVYKEGSAVKNLTSKDGKVVVLKAKWKKGTYKVRFDANGGTGKMKDQTFTCEESKKLLKNTYKKKGYVFTGWNTKKDGEGKTYKNSQKVKNLRSENGEMIILFAMWKGAPYKVTYKGNGATSGKMKSSNYVYGKKSKLSVNKYKKKGYTFVGWNTKKNGKGKNYKNKADIKNLTTQKNKTITLYAKWKIINYKITYNTKGGKLKKSAKKSYTITSKTFTLPRPTKKGYDFDGWYLDKKYKKRISEVKKGKTGNLKLYAKWAKCTGKISKTSAKITNCKAIGTGKIKVQASIKKRVGSSDEYYYLVNVNPMNQKVYRMVKKIYKKKKIGFTLKTSENPGYATSMFGIAVRKNGKYHLISSPNYVKSPEKAAKNKSKYKLGKTKKGIQFSSTIDEVYSCNAKQVFMNFTVSMLCNEATVPYHYNGKIYYFNEMCVYQQIISACNEKGISVSVQFMLDWTEGQTDLIAPAARVPNVAPYYSWNVTDNSAREKMEAMFCYLGYVFGRKNCYVSNWILGNEINNPKGWNYAGVMSTDNYFKTYAYAFRAFYCAIRSQYSNAHIFICMDNLWNTAVQGGYSTKYSITMFLKQLNKMQKGLKWNLAYHAYSTPLTYTNFWEGIGITYDENTPYITMKNLDVLTKYIKSHYGSSVRIILSEQGYSSVPWGEANQAAALAYSYYIAACNPMIDGFMIRSYMDHPIESAQGLYMGIAGKEAFEVFKYMDTSKTYQYTNRYLGIIGAKSWGKAVPRFKKSKLLKLYRRL